MYKFLLTLALCHSVVIEEREILNKKTKKKEPKKVFNAASPDELALVKGAADLGFEFLGISDEVMTIQVPDGR